MVGGIGRGRASLDELLVAAPGARIYRRRVLSVRGASLVAYWPMDELSGATAYDRGASGRNGAYSGVTFHLPRADKFVNGGFETAGGGGADIWGTWTEQAGDGALADEGTLVHGGSHAAKLTAGPTLNTRVIYESGSLAVLPGRAYRLTFWTRGDGTNSGRYNVYDATNSAAITGTVSCGVVGTTHTEVVVDFATPANCLLVSISLYCAAVNGGVCYFDDASCYALNANGVGDGRCAPYFDGTNDYLNVYGAGLAAAFSGAAGSVALWAKVKGAGVWSDGTVRSIVRLEASATNYVYINRTATLNELSWSYRAGGTTDSVTSTAKGGDLTWIHLALTWSKAAEELKAYADGAQVGATQGTLGTWAGSLAATTSVIGALSTAPASVWSGEICHAAVWSGALTAAEIARLSRVR